MSKPESAEPDALKALEDAIQELDDLTYHRPDGTAMRAQAALEHVKLVMRECCDAIRDQDDLGALRMLEIALNA